MDAAGTRGKVTYPEKIRRQSAPLLRRHITGSNDNIQKTPDVVKQFLDPHDYPACFSASVVAKLERGCSLHILSDLSVRDVYPSLRLRKLPLAW